ncbi:MAG: AbrB/MazE/SpoVT family DNA-binding domain-containing protein [Methanomassiliicoccaceae archaeon]|nr:AbrB/MazE/SpoVT family DNA-binding domain-containing protein [Methanomassiliicoccaceae archaeon]
MVLVGRSKYDMNGRITLLKELTDLLGVERGDFMEFHAEDGEIILRKMRIEKTSDYDAELERVRNKNR